MSIEDEYEYWKNGNLRPPNGWSFSNATNQGGLLLDPISLEPFTNHTSRTSSFLIGNTIYSSSTLKQLIENNEYYNALPAVADEEEFGITFKERFQNPTTRQNISNDDLKEIFSRIFANTSNIEKAQTFLQKASTRSNTMSRGGKRKKPTKKRIPTKKRRPTKSRKSTKRRRPTKRRHTKRRR